MGNGKRRQGEPITAANLTHSNSTSMSPSRCYKKNTKMSKVSTIACRDQSPLQPHRKVFMITEKSGDDIAHHGTPETQSSSLKRKMILIMDEKPTPTVEEMSRQLNCSKFAKIENEDGQSLSGPRTPNPKLLFFANSVDNQLSQKIEEILPEILNRIQWKNGRVVDVNDESAKKIAANPLAKQKQDNQRSSNQNSLRSSVLTRVNGTHDICLVDDIQEGRAEEPTKIKHNSKNLPQLKMEHEVSSSFNNSSTNNNSNNSNLMLLGAAAAATSANSVAANQVVETMRKITLPPKKNLSKFHHQLNGNSFKSNDGGEQIISAATPVIVSATSLNKTSYQSGMIPKNNQRNNSDNQSNKQEPQNQHQTQYHNHCRQQFGNVINSQTSPSSNDATDEKNAIVVKQENINLTGDFLFLMKMLPLLEKTPEPRKSHVKMLIEKIMKQCVAGEITEQT